MADNFAFTEGSGKTGAADEIGGVLYPRVKISQGADGSATDVSSAAPLQVSLANHAANATAVKVDGSAVTQPVSAASLPLPSGAATSAKQDTVIGHLDGVEGVLATIDADTGTIAGAVAGTEMQVDVVAALPAGTNNIGDVDIASALPAGNNNIGDIDVASIAAGDNNIGNVDVVTVPTDPFGANADAASATGSISAKLRFIASTGIPVTGTVTVASHAVTNAGTFAVQENGSALTALQLIDDTVATTASAITTKGIAAAGTDGTNARILKTDSSGELQVDVLTMPTVTVNSHAVTNAGTFAVQVDGSALTALQLIDDTVFTDDAAFTAGSSKVNATGAMADESSTDNVDEGDIGIVRMTLDRKQIITEQPHTAGGLTMSKTVSAASTNATSVKGSAGKIYAIQASNVNAAARYLKLYNKATAPTVGSDTIVKTLIIPGNTAGAGTNIVFPTGIEFTTGIAFALTTEATDAGTTGVAASEIVVNIDYK